MYVGLFQHSAADLAAPLRRSGPGPCWRLKENPYNGRTNAIVTMRMAERRGLGRVGGRRLLSTGPPQPLRARLGGW